MIKQCIRKEKKVRMKKRGKGSHVFTKICSLPFYFIYAKGMITFLMVEAQSIASTLICPPLLYF